MSRVQKVSYLSQLKSYIIDWSIQVKVLHTWKQTNACYGDKIQATCKHAYLISLGSKCVVGEWKNISNFSMTEQQNTQRR
ncbi:hypothetical protein IGI04_023351 [Brassica rapa subsp. trilocularis]|uniref:Replication protein A 70 kDa DNA-binding subunit B/D first OB fold domain-containing protein n=1 Tax=Brassica rapa subsp. trilocularis TaxID=1813537 RepID=A0ABQ7M5S3_BRACM|nr:hypothetical protein IGI04_023351 [Brassica rapa subsp. trilocularis]